MRRSTLSLIGFILFSIGLLSLIFSIVGLNFTFLSPLYAIGPGFAFLVYILFIFIGGIVLYVARTNQN